MTEQTKPAEATTADAPITTYKGFDKDLKCRGFQYAIGQNKGRAMASDTGAIVLAYRNEDGEIIHIRASKVGDNGIKAGVWYSLNEDGEFVEVDA